MRYVRFPKVLISLELTTVANLQLFEIQQMEATPSTVVDLANAPDEDADFVEEVEVEDEEIEEEAEDSEQDEKPKVQNYLPDLVAD